MENIVKFDSQSPPPTGSAGSCVFDTSFANLAATDEYATEQERFSLEAFGFYEGIAFSTVEQLPKLAEVLSLIRGQALFRRAGCENFADYVTFRLNIPAEFAALVLEVFGEPADSSLLSGPNDPHVQNNLRNAYEASNQTPPLNGADPLWQ